MKTLQRRKSSPLSSGPEGPVPPMADDVVRAERRRWFARIKLMFLLVVIPVLLFFGLRWVLGLRVAMGLSFKATKGYAAGEVEGTYERIQELSIELDDFGFPVVPVTGNASRRSSSMLEARARRHLQTNKERYSTQWSRKNASEKDSRRLPEIGKTLEARA